MNCLPYLIILYMFIELIEHEKIRIIFKLHPVFNKSNT
jgi:hypothetical protein